jgi:hypothetical protein
LPEAVPEHKDPEIARTIANPAALPACGYVNEYYVPSTERDDRFIWSDGRKVRGPFGRDSRNDTISSEGDHPCGIAASGAHEQIPAKGVHAEIRGSSGQLNVTWASVAIPARDQ